MSAQTKKRSQPDSDTPSGPGAGGGRKLKKRVRIDDPTLVGTGDVQGDLLYPSNNRNRDEVDDTVDLEPAKKRRGAVNLDGYGSGDSDDDDDDTDRPAAGNDDEDMFGDSFATEKFAAQPKKKGEIRFMAKEEIEGQEWNAEGDEYTEDGIKIEPFNMDQELEEGGFDESGHYVRKKDEHQRHDNWLQGVTRDQIQKAKAAHERQEARAKAQSALAESQMSEVDTNALLIMVLGFMKPFETVAAAMRRLGAGTQKVPAWKRNKKKSNQTKCASEEQTPEETEKRTRDIENLTSLCDKLMSIGQLGAIDMSLFFSPGWAVATMTNLFISPTKTLKIKDVYEQTYEQIVRTLRRAELLPEDWHNGDPVPISSETSTSSSLDPLSSSSSSVTTMWEFKWSREGEDVFGPYRSEEMKAWIEQGYFSQQQGGEVAGGGDAMDESESGGGEAVSRVYVRQVTQGTPLDSVRGFIPLSRAEI
ncbi:CD2 antigen cytoplasmic tail-binding protein 2 [Quaeritorhiza haematococci]|nr:CD2 antigen cytoplasmic tail-binding protein 2 [Quaeritorhiza haematococci]